MATETQETIKEKIRECESRSKEMREKIEKIKSNDGELVGHSMSTQKHARKYAFPFRDPKNKPNKICAKIDLGEQSNNLHVE